MTGCWRQSIASFIEHDIFIKELIPVTIAVLLLHRHLPHFIFGSALDNAGLVSRINTGSCASPIGNRMMTSMADALYNCHGYIISDWNNRDQPLAVHADTLSKIFTSEQWASAFSRPLNPPWIFDLAIKHLQSSETILTSIRIPRLSEALPNHFRKPLHHPTSN